jgi:deazaflavin-dependent oxidoreductase (nitroreductase family)
MAPPKPTGRGASRQFTKLMTRVHNLIYRMSGGRIGGRMFNSPVLLLTTTGRRSGQRRTIPLLYLKTPDGYAIAASYAGADRHPAWYRNLESRPEATIQVGAEVVEVTAETADAERRAELWPKLVEMYPDYAVYQARTERDIPVVLLRS